MFLITGGGSGIGRALAQALAQRNKRVLIAGRREQALMETAAVSPLIEYFPVDVSSKEGRLQLITHLKEKPHLEGIIHNAGIIEPISLLATIDECSWRRIMATNLDAPQFLNQALRPKLLKARVLHIGSGAAHFPVKAWGGYCVSKAALAMLTRCWQIENPELAFASVMPGIIDTDMQNFIRQASEMEEEKRNFFQILFQEKKLLSPETVARFLTWLLLDVDKETYVSKEWDIYDKAHHSAWLKEPFQVPDWE